MGYTTNFSGQFDIEPEPNEVITEYVNRFNGTRRMKRKDLPTYEAEVFADANIVGTDFVLGVNALPAKKAAGKFIVAGGYGVEGEFYVNAEGYMGQDADYTVINSSDPPSTQPGLWCQWKINEAGQLVWDEGEKFYDYVEWLKYLIANVFIPNGYTLSGSVIWSGEDAPDVGTIEVDNNVVIVHEGQVSYKKQSKTVECFDCGHRFTVEFP